MNEKTLGSWIISGVATHGYAIGFGTDPEKILRTTTIGPLVDILCGRLTGAIDPGRSNVNKPVATTSGASKTRDEDTVLLRKKCAGKKEGKQE